MPETIIPSRAWRCSCGSLLDYDYHMVWRCRGCNATHHLLPMQPLDIRVQVNANPFVDDLLRAQKALA